MYRNLLVCAAMCCLAACFPPPGTPSLLQTPVSGAWRGAFSSSWGEVPITATLSNDEYSQGISGSFTLEGQRATGTISGTLQTRSEVPDNGLFHGQLSISYVTPSGETCRSTGQFTGGGSGTFLTFESVTGGFTAGNCPDPPTNVRLTLRR
jgi:hypothetical protein